MPHDPALAAATLLPILDGQAAAGDPACASAADLIRTLLSRPPPTPQRPPDESFAHAFERLATLVREQDRQITRLHAMLDTLL